MRMVTRLTVDELARAVGMTVRNVRAHQSRGLLPPPLVEGRVGFYNADHVARLQLIQDMQADGFNLRAIRHALDRIPAGAAAEVRALRREVVEPWTPEESAVATRDELAALFGAEDDAALEQSFADGVLRDLGDDRVEVRSPALVQAGAQLRELGVPLDALIAMQSALVEHAQGVSQLYVELFLEHVWRPFVAAGQPEDRWPAVHAALTQMQPLASQALLAVLRVAMQDAVSTALETELEGLADQESRGA